MCDSLRIQLLSHGLERRVELPRLDYRPGDNREFSAVKATDEVVLLFASDDLLEFQAEPVIRLSETRKLTS